MINESASVMLLQTFGIIYSYTCMSLLFFSTYCSVSTMKWNHGSQGKYLFHFFIHVQITVKRGNFDWRGNFDRSGSFVKLATVPIQQCLFVASALMEINEGCSGLRIYMYLRPCLHRSNLKTSYKLSISRKNWPFFKIVLTYWMVPCW